MSVRVRIAPSPTGEPHVGTAYISLFNYVFARKNNGSFVLRIEDTDVERSSKESEIAILNSLKWLGIQWDEGPDIGGEFGPYRQSERKEIYKKYGEIIIERGGAYYCFCSEERLEALRRRQKIEKKTIGYDGFCRNLSHQSVKERIEKGEPYVIRLKMPREGETTFKDELRGLISYPNAQIDDQILIKSDGFPTYHFANVVDDHLMKITHVIRAEEWIPSTPKHIVLYDAFGWEKPRFHHMPLLRNKDRSKISKRKNPVSIEFYRKIGILPETLLNFLALMGWSMPDEREFFSLDEMIENFSWDRISLGGPVFDLEKLLWLNGIYLRKLSDEELLRKITDEVYDKNYLKKIILLVKERIRALGEFPFTTSFFFGKDVDFSTEDVFNSAGGKEKDELMKILKEYIEEIDTVNPWNNIEIENHLRKFCETKEWKASSFFMVLRIIITGRKVSPPLIETMELLGKNITTYRIRKALEKLQRSLKGRT